MGDWKKDLSKLSSHVENSSGKKCEKCGKPLKDDKYRHCFNCNEGMKGVGSSGGGMATDYLSKGYFDEKGNLFERYVARGGDADIIANKLGYEKPAMTTHQLRRFYGHVRAAENRLQMTGNFPAIYIDLKKLEPFVAEAKGKGKIPDLFYDVMNKNLSVVKTQKDFTKGFLEHFQAIVAFFAVNHPKK
jgi:CRISPR-associated protein Csm2